MNQPRIQHTTSAPGALFASAVESIRRAREHLAAAASVLRIDPAMYLVARELVRQAERAFLSADAMRYALKIDEVLGFVSAAQLAQIGEDVARLEVQHYQARDAAITAQARSAKS